MPMRRRFKPAFHFAGPGHLVQLFLNSFRAVAFSERDEIEILEHATVPPGNKRGVARAERLRIDPGAVLVNGGGAQLIEHRQFEPVSEVALTFELAEKLLDDISRDN